MPQVKRGSVVLVHYTAMLKNKKVVETTAGGDPLRITVGAGKVMRGLEESLEGMSPGESKRVIVPPEKAFGRRKAHGAAHLSMGTSAMGDRPTEFQHQVVNRMAADEYCITTTDKGLQIDLNPHLAGEEVTLEIEVVDIET